MSRASRSPRRPPRTPLHQRPQNQGNWRHRAPLPQSERNFPTTAQSSLPSGTNTCEPRMPPQTGPTPAEGDFAYLASVAPPGPARLHHTDIVPTAIEPEISRTPPACHLRATDRSFSGQPSHCASVCTAWNGQTESLSPADSTGPSHSHFPSRTRFIEAPRCFQPPAHLTFMRATASPPTGRQDQCRTSAETNVISDPSPALAAQAVSKPHTSSRVPRPAHDLPKTRPER